jgi:hypothetical protein
MALATLAGLGALLSGVAGVAGAVVSYVGAQKAEKLRLRQMNLEAARERRKTLRETIIARSAALNAAAATGIEGSGVAGGTSNIVSQGGSTTQAINQNQEIGQQMFGANMQISLGQTLSSIGAGIGTMTNAFSGSNADTTLKLKKFFQGGGSF